jgi:hypothetical protein
MSESESATRKKRINTRLCSALLNWEIIHNDKAKDTSEESKKPLENGVITKYRFFTQLMEK